MIQRLARVSRSDWHAAEGRESRRHILLVSFIPPMQSTGTPIILERHLLELERKAWRISIVAPQLCIPTGHKFSDSWQVIPLGRRWWWPPFRPNIPGSLKIRLHLWQRECEQALCEKRPAAILTVLWGVYPVLAMHLSRRWKVPLSVIIHDQEELWATSNAEQQLLKERSTMVLGQADRIWPVSRELGDVYQLPEKKKLKVLLPIPDKYCRGFVEWKNHFEDRPVIAYAGSLHSFQFSNLQGIASVLQRINGTLLLVTDNDNPVLAKLRKTYQNVQHRNPFEKNKDAVKFLSENASCILVSCSFDITEQRWAVSSFPSKLVEFSQIGLPILILAPPFAAISTWAKRRHWISYISELDQTRLASVLIQLTSRETWLKMATQTREVALSEFCPDLIQAQFESELAIVRN